MTSQSKCAMFRAAIALVWADGELADAERIKLTHFINHNTSLSAEQKAQLIKDMENRIHLDDIWGEITEMDDRAYVINIAETLFNADGHYSSDEKALYDRMFNQHMKTVDTTKLKDEMAGMMTAARESWAKEEKAYLDDMKRIRSGIPGTNDLELMLYKLDKWMSK